MILQLLLNSHENKISGTKKVHAKTNATFIFKKMVAPKIEIWFRLY